MKLEFNATVEKFMKLVELDDTLCIVGYKKFYDSDLFIVSNYSGYFMYLDFEAWLDEQPCVSFAIYDDMCGWEGDELDMITIREYLNTSELFQTLRSILLQYK